MNDTNKLPDYLKRMIVENKELQIKLGALTTMLKQGQPKFVSDNQWLLMQRQHEHMKQYQAVLGQRIDDAVFNL